MFEALDRLWDSPVQGWWIQVCWMMIAAFWAFHTLLRVAHVVVTWPSDRKWRSAWIVVSIICTIYFLAQMQFGDVRDRTTVGNLSRIFAAMLLVVTLIFDALRGVVGTVSRRANRAKRAAESAQNEVKT